VLLGHPVAHSLSPRFQNAALRRAGIPLVYEAIDVAPADLARTLEELRSLGAAGNVTIPHKEAVASHCDELTPVARRAGAANTFWVEGGRLVGDNTDVGGFEAAVDGLLADAPGAARPRSIGLLGAGGSAAAVLVAVERWPGAQAAIFNRTPERARALRDRFPHVARLASSPREAVRGAQLIVNATPVGLAADGMPIDPELVEAASRVIDLVYRPGGTAWVQALLRRGIRAIDGTTVLLEQGALAFQRWFGLSPNRDAMRAALTG
jgi:shikimate dehydrogenase